MLVTWLPTGKPAKGKNSWLSPIKPTTPGPGCGKQTFSRLLTAGQQGKQEGARAAAAAAAAGELAAKPELLEGGQSPRGGSLEPT